MADSITVNAGAALPEFERKRTFEKTTPGDTSTTETPTETPERAAAGAELARTGTEEVAAAKEGQAQADLEAPVKREAADANAALASQQADAKVAAMNEAAADIAAARERTKARQAELDAMDAPSMFGNTDTWGKVMRGAAMALGGIGDAIQTSAYLRIGKSPPAMDTVHQIIDDTINQQKDHINKLKDSVVMARTGEADAVAARQQMLSDVDLRGASMFARTKALMEARLAAMGKTPEQIAADANVASTDAKRAESLAKHVEPLLGRITKKIEGATVKSGGETTDRVPGKAQGAAPTGATAEQSAALAKYVDAHPNASQGELVDYAKSLQIPDAQGEVTRVAGTNSLPEKERERQTVDFEGKPVLAGSARQVPAVADQVASTQRATKAIDGLIASIGDGGIIKAGQSHLPGTELNSKINEATGLISQSMGLSPSDAKIKMDHAMSGTGGIGVLTGGAAKSLQRLRDEIQEFGTSKLKGMTTPVRENVTREVAPAPRAAQAEVAPARASASPKAQAIELVKARPNAPGAKLLRKKFAITDAELAQ